MDARGCCLCGQVRFRVRLPAIVMNHCHCSRCRKASGAAMGTYLHVARDHFQWQGGDDAIVHYQPKEGDARPFCARCGSRVPVIADDGVIVPAGLLDDDPQCTPAVHLHVASKPTWSSIRDSLPSFPEGAPDHFWEPFLVGEERH